MNHILVVDDEVEMTHALEECLMRHGYRVTVTHRGEEALRIAKACYPDLVLLDLGLPDMPGEAVCQEIKHSFDLKLRHTPVVVLTGKMSDVDHVYSMVIGATAYFEKPVSLGELLQTLEKVLGADGRTAHAA